jgi:hypothetical protein
MIRIYTDSETTKTIEALDLGRVLLGETKKYTVFIKNTDSEWPVHNIKIENTNPELRFEAPQTLEANEVKEVAVYWTPKLDSRKPLRTEFKFSGDIFIG